MKKLVLLSLLFTALLSFSQPLKSPEQFLGYKLGTRFTPHYKVIEYVKSVATAKPDMVRVEKYGETYEGRELWLIYVSSAENMGQLEFIRQNNLAMAGIEKQNIVVPLNPPAIVWLSYNVHGNEPSSSEVSMLTLYELVDPSNARTKAWLKNTVVIIDPCLNPDGRDRYVNWFNSVSGKNIDADPQAREHEEPWPGGRGNHYSTDLNRDWAWQSQIETSQRLVKYNDWLPHVHVDFHEQHYNSPYYFAPAAEPFHEVITPWQREFQTTIGKQNARYFDEQGWLYFTRQYFDLFYPSYGDTYPLYNGAIGMTYEQAGHSSGGLAVVTNSGDTLTLADRIEHHHNAGLSTIEVTSLNAVKVVEEFKKFYADSRAGKGNNIKTYVLTSDEPAVLQSIGQLLKANDIVFGSVSGPFTGTSYSNGKEEKAQLKKYNLAISTSQPKSVLAKVLLEPSSNLPDSVTYDITAWSLPYAYNVNAYTVKEALPIKPFTALPDPAPLQQSSYGYLVKYNGIKSAELLGQLLKKGVKVRYAEKPFTYNKKEFARGTLIILQKENSEDIRNLLSNSTVEIEAVATGFMEKGPDFGSDDVKLIRTPKVALVTGGSGSATAAGEIWHLFDRQLDYPISLIDDGSLESADLSKYNVLIFNSGSHSNLSDSNFSEKLKDFVSNGGNIIVMGSAVQQLANDTWELKKKTDDKKDTDSTGYDRLKRYEDRERNDVMRYIPGTIFKVELDNSHPLAFGYPDTYYTLKTDTTVYEFLEDGWNVGYIKTNSYVSGFAGSKVKHKIKDSLVFGVMHIGGGTVTILADNPLFRQFWEGGKLLFCNAVFLVGH